MLDYVLPGIRKRRVSHARSNIGRVVVCLLSALLVQTTTSVAQNRVAQNPDKLQLIGYADRLSVQPGETIQFMVSSKLPRYQADLVRLIQGDDNPIGPGFKEIVIDSPLNQEYPGRYQDLPNGSYVEVIDHPVLRATGNLTLQAWIAPTTPLKGVQGILTKWSVSEQTGYGLFIDEDGSLALWIGDKNGRAVKIRTGKPLRAWTPANQSLGGQQMVQTTTWYFVAATFDATNGTVRLYQEPFQEWPGDTTQALVTKTTPLRSIGRNEAPLLIAGSWQAESSSRRQVVGHFNGKIESPRIFSRSLPPSEIGALRQGDPATDPVATWDFSLDFASRKVTDNGPNHLHGRTVQMPMRAATGHLWSGNELNFKHAPTEYGAIYFHDDDLDDASWEADFELRVPADLKSGVYAARLRAGKTEDYIPFFVRPTKGAATSKIALLIPTFSYLAYANFLESSQTANSDIEHKTLLSLYDKHSDGSGVAYSSRLRPILNMRPKLVDVWNEIAYPHQLTADLHLVGWLEQKALDHDVITDGDLHWEGEALLEPYNVILTGTHPEYVSGQMLEGLRAYLQGGGRLMYLGGNGFYWVTSMDLEQRHTVEVRRHGGGQTWEAAPGEYYHSTTGEPGGLWRARGRPPNSLVGVGFTAMGAGPGRPFHRQSDSFDPRAAWIFEGIGPDEPIGDNPSLVFEYGAAGMEVDRFDRVLGTPPHALLLATAKDFSNVYQHAIEEVMINDAANVPQGEAGRTWVKADMVYFETPNGGAVFSASSISWCGSLSYNNYENAVSKITENVLTRFVSDKSLPVPTAQEKR